MRLTADRGGERLRLIADGGGEPAGPTADELAGIVDLFGWLTPEELANACEELAFRGGEELEDLDGAVETAIEEYALVTTTIDDVSPDGDESPDDDDSSDDDESSLTDVTALHDRSAVIAGPAAFPVLPDGAEDLPHILDVPGREVDRETVGNDVCENLLAEAEKVEPETERAAVLREISYDLEAWAPVDASAVRERLEGD